MRLISIFLLLSIFFSCSKIEDLDKRTQNMDDSTEEMKDTTKGMSETTEDLKEISEGMSITTEELLMLSRQGATSDLREKAKDVLLNEKRGMGDILTAAKKYFFAFEYQLWNGRGEDTPEERVALIVHAMEEFYRLLNDLNKGFEGTTPVFIEEADSKTKAFYAIATTMHFNNDKQGPRVAQIEGISEISLYDIIKMTLEKYHAGTELNDYEQVVVLGENYKITENLLNARMNFITALGVKDMVTGKEDMTWKQLLQAGILKKWWLEGLDFLNLGEIYVRSTYEVQNIYTQKDIKIKLDGALKTKKILIDNNLNVRVDGALESMLENLRHPVVTNIDGSQSPEDTAVYELIDEIIK